MSTSNETKKAIEIVQLRGFLRKMKLQAGIIAIEDEANGQMDAIFETEKGYLIGVELTSYVLPNRNGLNSSMLESEGDKLRALIGGLISADPYFKLIKLEDIEIYFKNKLKPLPASKEMPKLAKVIYELLKINLNKKMDFEDALPLLNVELAEIANEYILDFKVTDDFNYPKGFSWHDFEYTKSVLNLNLTESAWWKTVIDSVQIKQIVSDNLGKIEPRDVQESWLIIMAPIGTFDPCGPISLDLGPYSRVFFGSFHSGYHEIQVLEDK